jgi:hypothetical protein
MQSPGTPVAVSKKMMWIGYIVAAPAVLLLLMSGVMKLMQPPSLVEGFVKSGYPAHLIVPLGIVEVACTVFYLIPATEVLGAILLTGYLGGAIATNVRIENNQFPLPLLMGILLWGGLWFRDLRIRALIPIRK